MKLIKDVLPEITGAILSILLLGLAYVFFSFLIEFVDSHKSTFMHSSDTSNIIPLSVLVAIIIFLAKEILELIRNHKNRLRKTSAIKALLSEEIEKNYWAIKSYKSVVKSVRSELQRSNNPVFEVRSVNNDSEHFECVRPGGHNSSQDFPKVFDKDYKKLAMDIAELDQQLHEAATRCYKSVAELQHIRTSVYQYIDRNGDSTNFMEGFLIYIEDQVPQIYSDMNELYLLCTGEKLQAHRLR